MALFITVGMPGSGKTTTAKTMFGNAVVSADDWKADFSVFHERVEGALDGSRRVVADYCNLDRHERLALSTSARNKGHDVHVLFFKNSDEALRRNQQRPRPIPEDIMVKCYDKLKRAYLQVAQERYESVLYVASIAV